MLNQGISVSYRGTPTTTYKASNIIDMGIIDGTGNFLNLTNANANLEWNVMVWGDL
jgi:hypothetical protein